MIYKTWPQLNKFFIIIDKKNSGVVPSHIFLYLSLHNIKYFKISFKNMPEKYNATLPWSILEIQS